MLGIGRVNKVFYPSIFIIIGFKALHTCEVLKTEVLYIVFRKKIIFKWSFLILNIILYFLLLTNIWQFHLSNWQGMGLVWAISVFVYTGLLFQGIP